MATLGVLALAACGGGGGGSAANSSSPQSGVAAPAQRADAATVQAVPVAQGPRIIRNASLTLEVANGDFDKVLTRLIDLSANEGGYLSASEAGGDGGDHIRTGTFTFAVPVDRYEETIKTLRGYGTVQSFRAGSQDVSAQYVDLQSRLKNAEAQRDAMLALLTRATQIPDIINIQNQVGQIEAQIEQLKGQIDYLDHATSYSTISVSLREAEVGAKDQLGLRSALDTALTDFFVSIDFMVIALGALAPYLLLVLAGLGGFVLWRRRRLART